MEDADIVVLTFERFELECTTDGAGRAYDYVEVFDGSSPLSPVLANRSCVGWAPRWLAPPALASTGSRMLVAFTADDSNAFGGFEARYSSGRAYCSAARSCGACAALDPCGWCAAEAACKPIHGAFATCGGGALPTKLAASTALNRSHHV